MLIFLPGFPDSLGSQTKPASTGEVSSAHKRGLPGNITPKGRANKRAKKFMFTRDDSESSDDELKFKFHKRKS